jgi:lysophospholipase L1-like esterase
MDSATVTRTERRDQGADPDPIQMRSVIAPLAAIAFGLAMAATLGEIGVRVLAPQPLQHIQLDDQIYFVNRPFARFTYSREDEYSIEVTYNAWGFRGPIPASNPPLGVTRIVLIGDSQTEGLQVHYEETYGEVLRRNLERLLPDRHFEVINLAVSAYGTHQEVLTLRRYGPRVRPCWVVLGFYPGNDLADNVRLPLVAEDTNGVRLAEHRFSIGHRLWLGTKVWLGSVSHLYTLLVSRGKALFSRPLSRAGILEPSAPPVAGASRPLVLTEQLLLIARNDATSLGSRLIVLMIPERAQIMRPAASEPSSQDAVDQQFVAWFEHARILYLATSTALRAAYRRGERAFFLRDGHLNATGHRIVGEALADRMAPLIQKSTEDSCAR